ncbi:FecCD family ABC transporter permease [Corynebacterium casei]
MDKPQVDMSTVGEVETSPAAQASDAEVNKTSRRAALFLSISVAVLAVLAVFALGFGQMQISAGTVFRILWHDFVDLVGLENLVYVSETWGNGEHTTVTLVRLPRVLGAIFIGGGLAIAGAALQSLFRNQLVSPDVIGVSSASAFGGVLGILLGFGAIAMSGMAFVFGLLAAALVLLLGRVRTSSPVLTIVLGGIVISALFNALVSLVTYVADPYEDLPAITFWLMGSLASMTWQKAMIAMVCVTFGSLVVYALRWRINILSLSDEDARALGLNPNRLRWVLILAASLITASTVAAAGVIGWVGLVIPHLVRLLVGHDNRVVIPGCFFIGGAYLLLIDTIARTISSVEIPVGILTAIIGAPVFIFLLVTKMRQGGGLD